MKSTNPTYQELKDKVLELEAKLVKTKWLHDKKYINNKKPYTPFYGDVTELNTERTILDNVGKEKLKILTSELMDLLDTSVAIYEKNGDYAYGVFNSGWCQLLDASSRKLCNTNDNKTALNCGKWLCHDDCWLISKTSIVSQKTQDKECVGKLRLFAEPIFAGEKVIGSINIGYGNPPTDDKTLKELSEKYSIDFEIIKQKALAYNTRPDYIFEVTKKRLKSIAQLIGEIVLQKQTEKQLIKIKEQADENEAKFEAAVENSQAGIAIADAPTGKLIYVNKAGLLIRGKDENEIVKDIDINKYVSSWQILHLDGTPYKTEEVPLARAVLFGETNSKEFIVRRDNLEDRYVWANAAPIHNNKGEIKYGIVVFLDITERKQAEQALKESEEKYRQLIENINDLVCEIDENGIYTFVSKNYETILGYTPNELIGKQVIELIHSADLQLSIEKHSQIKNETGQSTDIWRFKHKNGSYRFIESKGKVYHDNEGGKKTVVISRDITEQKKHEQQIIEQNEEYEALNEELRQTNEELLAAKVNAEENEERYRELVDIINTGVAVYKVINEGKTGSDYIVRSFNQFALKHEKMSIEEVVGKSLKDIRPNIDDYGLIDVFQNVWKTGKPTFFPEKIYIDDKFSNYYENSVFKLSNGNIIAVYDDVTVRKNAELELKNINEIVLLENKISNSFILAENEEFYNVILNDILSTLNCKFGYFGYIDLNNEEKLICPSMTYDIWDECKMPQKSIEFPKKIWSGIWGESLIKKKSIYKNSGLKFPNGHVQLRNALAVPILLKNELIGQIVVGNHSEDFEDRHKKLLENICNYISPLLYAVLKEQQYQSKLIKAKEKAEESNRLKTAFLQNLSHEIRTPLNAICGFSGMLSKPKLTNEKRSSFVSIIQTSSNQLLSIVSDILTISALETKQEKINIEKTCINNIVVDLLSIFKQQSINQNISLYAKQPLNDKQSEIHTDKTKITQILSNLISNALKFTHEGFIEFGYNLKNNELEFYVKDSGVGIKSEQQEKIFERFRQADLSINKKYGGTGLGLSISKGFVELLGGKIWVNSEIDKGSTFYFTIPYKPVNKIDEPITQNERDNKPIILVAEDEEFNFLYIEELLIDFDYKLIHAKDGKEAVEITEKNNEISLILMDIKMPIMDGHTAAKIIKEQKKELPIIAQSAYALEHEIEKYSGIFDDYLAKPIKEELLIEKVNKYMINK